MRRLRRWILLTTGAGALGVVLWYVFRLPLFEVDMAAMAPGLLGPHVSACCGGCGQEAVVGIPSGTGTIVERTEVACPRCSRAIAVSRKAGSQSGDKIILQRGSRPRRWERVAYRTPSDREQLSVLRVVGLPGEAIEIRDGDVFVDGKHAVKEPAVAPEMWIPVCATDVEGKNEARPTTRWLPAQGGSGWKQNGRGWRLDAARDEEESLQLQGDVTDALVYNAFVAGGASQGPSSVKDIRLECHVQACSGDGCLGLVWSRSLQYVKATIDLKGSVSLTCSGSEALGKLQPPLAAGDRVELAVRDGQAYVACRGQVLARLTIEPQDVPRLLTPPGTAPMTSQPSVELSISGRGVSIVLSRIAVYRDVHYVGASAGTIGRGRVSSSEGELTRLGPGEYFLLGDNPAIAADSRWWGPLPQAKLIGSIRRLR